MTQLETCFNAATPNLNVYAREAVHQVVQDLCKRVMQNSNFDNRQRSGSVPVQKIIKQTDMQSISTMAGTIPSYKSDNKIQDIDPKRIQIKVPQSKKNQQSGQHVKEAGWSLDKNGYIISSSLDITTIKYYFIKVATKFGMTVMRDLQDVITIKTQKIDSMRCLFMMCLPLMSDKCVYQLQRYRTNKGSKIKLNLISGIQSKYDEFIKCFFYELWNKDVLELTNFQALNLICHANKNIISESMIGYGKACSQFQIKNLGSQQQIQIWKNQLILNFRRCQQNMKQVIFAEKGKKIIRNKSNQVMIQRILMNEIPVCEFYLKLQMESNREFYQRKRKILKNYSLKRVFQYLQIDSGLLDQKFLECSKLIQEISYNDLPYYEAVQYLDDLSLAVSPLQNIENISRFADKLLKCFEHQCGKSEYFMDMDSQLPLTIYCCLVSKNSQLKPTISLLCDYFEAEDDYESQNRTLAALKAGLQYVRQQWSGVDGSFRQAQKQRS